MFFVLKFHYMLITLTLEIVFMKSQNINMHNYSPIFCNIEISNPSIFINSNNSFISLNSFFAVFCRSFSVWTAQLFAWNFERWSVRYSHTYRLWVCYGINKNCKFQLLFKLLIFIILQVGEVCRRSILIFANPSIIDTWCRENNIYFM